MPAPLAPVTLEGAHVRLEPLAPEHLGALCEVGLDPGLWRLNPSPVASREDMARYVQIARDAHARGEALPFATVDLASGTVVGSTRLGNVALGHRRVEIGWTWIAAPWQRTAINTEAKLLLLRHAFGPLACNRVELKTDARNARSQEAMRRIGATREGTLRHHMVTASGHLRDTVYFSILREEWPAVEAGLVRKLGR